MRRHLMLSTAAVGLMLASGLAYAQAPSERKDEPKRTEQPAKGAAEHGRKAAEERAHGAQERAREERAQGAAREEKGSEPQQAAEEKGHPSAAEEHNRSKSAEEHNGSKANAKTQESRESAHERNREAEGAKQGHESTKSSAETKSEKSGAQKSAAETEKSGNGSAAQQKEHTGAAANESDHNQKQPSRSTAEKQPSTQGNQPSTASETNRTPSTNNAQNAPATGVQNNQASRTNNMQAGQQSRVTPEKQVRMSETFSRAHLAAPVRDLNVPVRVGEAIPPRVHLYPLPPEIVSIEPEYRDYDYFTTDDDVVIVEPGTHRIVSEVPRDPSRARAELSDGAMAAGGGAMAAGGSMAAAGGGNVNCRIMRRDASGNVAEVQPSTVGSSARPESLSVTVQLPGGGSSAPIALGAPAGDIVVATQGQGDCTVTLEPQQR